MEIKEVVLYTKENCGQCAKTKEWLKDNDIEYDEKSLYEDQETLDKILDMNFRAAPVLSVNDFELAYSGFQPDVFDALFNGEE